MPHFTPFKNNLGSKCIRIILNDKKCFCLSLSPPILSILFWVLALNPLCSPRRGRGQIRIFSSLYSGVRAAHSRGSWAPFSEGSLGTTPFSIRGWTGFRDKLRLQHRQPHFTYGSGMGEVQQALSARAETSADCVEPLPTPGVHAGRKMWGCPRHCLSSAPPHHPLARTCRQMAQSTLPFIFRILTALCKSQLCP